MSEELLGLTLAYVFLTALLLIAIIAGRIRWPIKAGLIVISIVFYAVSYSGWKHAQGWPSKTALPDKFLLHHAVIEEPNDARGEQGMFYLWVTDLKHDELADKPRAFEIPYDQATHAVIEQALKKTRSGQPQLGQPVLNVAKPFKPKQQNALGQKIAKFDFTDVPVPALPEK